ncbi:Uncharacterized protein Rs2_21408 [Raphanus sativus]|nr:Uncharacterized protein Rs2_21408 [Raphanus sativus]
MSHRYSRTEKGKARATNITYQKPLVKVPESDVSELIERNKLTLIGRVTNPKIQKTRAMVDFFLQQWNVSGRITGRALGPSLFQFGFESEKDLQSILSKAPFHFKRWMLILQRWEPIISESFPNRIPFWINVHGIPLHYWNDKTIDVIGPVLGHVDVTDATKARLRVSVNGLQPLIMKMDLELPSGKVVENMAITQHHKDDRSYLGISQQNTLENIEEGKRRQEDRKRARQNSVSNQGGARWPNYKRSNRGDEYERLRQSQHRSPPRERRAHWTTSESGFEENKRRYEDRNLIPRNSPPPRRYRESQEGISYTSKSQSKAPQSAIGNQKAPNSPVRANSMRSNLSPIAPHATPQKRQSISSRLSEPLSGNRSGEARVSAKERLSVNTQRIILAEEERGETEAVNNASLQGLEVALQSPPNVSITRPSSSNVFDVARLGPGERSPIRSLSEDRIHVSLRLGPLLSESTEETETDESYELPVHPGLSAKAAGKRIVRRKVASSPSQGGPTKRRRTAKLAPSPRRKLMIDAITTGGRAPKKSQTKKPNAKLIPAMTRKEKDFHPLQKSLP